VKLSDRQFSHRRSIRDRSMSSAPTGVPEPSIETARLSAELLTAVGTVSMPTRWDRLRAMITGYRDGRHGLLPDPDCGHTQHTARIADEFGSTLDSERLTLSRVLSAIDELTGRLTVEATQLRASVQSAEEQTLTAREPNALVAKDLDERRRARDLAARQARHQSSIAAERTRIHVIERDLAALGVLRAYQIETAEHRIDRARVTRQQIVDVYWRWFVRTHPEESAVRAGYPIPSAARPAVTAAALNHRSSTSKGL